MDAWQSRGDILRWWRTEVLGLTQRQLATKLSVGRTAVTNWEGGTRLAPVDVERIDQALGADGVLAGLLWAFGTPGGLEPGRVWSNVFPGPSSTVWMWIRSPSPRVGIEAEWGMYRMEGEFDFGPNGYFVTCGVSIEESPALVELSEAGWVDFGRGELPIECLDRSVVDAVELVQPGTASGDFTAMLSTNVAQRFERSRPREMAELDPDSLKPIESFIDDLDRCGKRQPPMSWPSRRDGLAVIDRSRFARLREARQLSLTETSHRLHQQTGTVAGRDTLRRFEAGEGEPHDPLLPAALDRVLGGNGHLAMLEVARGRGNGVVKIPPYWDAPVWLAFEAPTAGAVAELQWGDWKRVVEGRPPLLVISHAPMIPLRIAAAETVRWSAGLGRREGAQPINHGWVPASVDTSQQALSHYEKVFVEAVRHGEATRTRRDRNTAVEDGEG